jgi:predicted ATP-dependent endonuclease of OLD family
MKIKHIHIEHFRSIKSLSFTPTDYSVLIGENNSGKSNILRALQLIIGESWPSERLFSENDFYKLDTSKEIIIRILFDQCIEQWSNNYNCQIYGFQLTCKAYKRKTGKKNPGDLKCDYNCVDDKGELVKYPAEPLKKGEKYEGQWFPLRVNSEMRESIPLIYVDVMREYDRHSPSGRWTILRKLFDDVNREFKISKEIVEIFNDSDQTKLQLTRQEAYKRKMESAYELLKTDSFKKIEGLLTKNALEHMGLSEDEGSITLHFDTHDPSNVYKSLQLFVTQLGIETSASDVGAGLQSAIVVGILRTYEELKREGAVFAIEEPEVFLHPQKARYFMSVLHTIADSGNQVFVSTHSPIFVNIHRTEDVCIVRRTIDDGTTVSKPDKLDITLEQRETLRLLTEFDTHHNELFFARKVLLVEGNTEKIIFPLAFKALGYDINKLGISIIDCGGKTKIPLFIKVCKSIEMPFSVVVDEDIHPIDAKWSDKEKAKQKDDNEKHNRWNKEISLLVQDEPQISWLSPDIEATCDLPRNNSTKIDRAYEMFTNIEAKNIPEAIKGIIEKMINL